MLPLCKSCRNGPRAQQRGGPMERAGDRVRLAGGRHRLLDRHPDGADAERTRRPHVLCLGVADHCAPLRRRASRRQPRLEHAPVRLAEPDVDRGHDRVDLAGHTEVPEVPGVRGRPAPEGIADDDRAQARTPDRTQQLRRARQQTDQRVRGQAHRVHRRGHALGAGLDPVAAQGLAHVAVWVLLQRVLKARGGLVERAQQTGGRGGPEVGEGPAQASRADLVVVGQPWPPVRPQRPAHVEQHGGQPRPRRARPGRLGTWRVGEAAHVISRKLLMIWRSFGPSRFSCDATVQAITWWSSGTPSLLVCQQTTRRRLSVPRIWSWSAGRPPTRSDVGAESCLEVTCSVRLAMTTREKRRRSMSRSALRSVRTIRYWLLTLSPTSITPSSTRSIFFQLLGTATRLCRSVAVTTLVVLGLTALPVPAAVVTAGVARLPVALSSAGLTSLTAMKTMAPTAAPTARMITSQRVEERRRLEGGAGGAGHVDMGTGPFVHAREPARGAPHANIDMLPRV